MALYPFDDSNDDSSFNDSIPDLSTLIGLVKPEYQLPTGLPQDNPFLQPFIDEDGNLLPEYQNQPPLLSVNSVPTWPKPYVPLNYGSDQLTIPNPNPSYPANNNLLGNNGVFNPEAGAVIPAPESDNTFGYHLTGQPPLPTMTTTPPQPSSSPPSPDSGLPFTSPYPIEPESQQDDDSSNSDSTSLPDGGYLQTMAYHPQQQTSQSLSEMDSQKPLDIRSENNLNYLHPYLQKMARQHVNTLNRILAPKGEVAKITDGYRSFEDQDKIYQQGRTTPGPIVSNAPAGSSYHNYGLAYDIGIFDNHGRHHIEDGSAYDLAGKIGKSLGLRWGGNLKSINDRPHYEYGPAIDTLKERKKKGLPYLQK